MNGTSLEAFASDADLYFIDAVVFALINARACFCRVFPDPRTDQVLAPEGPGPALYGSVLVYNAARGRVVKNAVTVITLDQA